jgi:hypothetical protein
VIREARAKPELATTLVDIGERSRNLRGQLNNRCAAVRPLAQRSPRLSDVDLDRRFVTRITAAWPIM